MWQIQGTMKLGRLAKALASGVNVKRRDKGLLPRPVSFPKHLNTGADCYWVLLFSLNFLLTSDFILIFLSHAFAKVLIVVKNLKQQMS